MPTTTGEARPLFQCLRGLPALDAVLVTRPPAVSDDVTHKKHPGVANAADER